MPLSRILRALAPAVVYVSLAGSAASEAKIDVVRACVRANAPVRSVVQTLSWSIRDRIGEVSESRAKLYWRRMPDERHRVLLRFQAPEDLEGSALLAHVAPGDRPVVHLYLPDLGRAQRVYSSSQVEHFLGRGGLELEDLLLFVDPGFADEESLVLSDSAEVDGRSSWEVETRSSRPAGGSEERVVTHVDREYCVPLEVRFFGIGERLLRSIHIDASSVARTANTWVPRRVVFRDVEASSETFLRVESVEIDGPLAPSLLTVQALSAGRR